MIGGTLTAAWVAFTVTVITIHRPRPPARRSQLVAPSVVKQHGPVARRWGRRRRARQHRSLTEAGVPDLVDLFAVAVGAGLNVRLAVEAVSRRAPARPIALAFRRVVDEVNAGGRLAEALETLPQRLDAEAVRPLVRALVDAERYGEALGPTLDRLADEARRSRQRRAEEAARRVPVKLLFPLVACVLPAFGLLTVAPLIAGGLRALRL